MTTIRYLDNISSISFKGFPAQPEIEKSLIKIRARLGEGIGCQDFEKYDLIEVYSIVKKKWEKDKSLSSLDKRTLKRLPFALFRNNLGDYILANDQFLLRSYLDWIKNSLNTRVIISLLSEFFYNYNPNRFWFEPTRTFLIESLKYGESARLKRIFNLVEKNRLLDLDAPSELASRILQVESVESFFRSIGLGGRLSKRGLAEYVFLSVSRIITTRIKGGTITLSSLNSYIYWFVPTPKQFFFQEQKAVFINHLLEPFHQGDNPEKVKEILLPFLIENFGDPRINKEHWDTTSATARLVINRWLVKSTLEDFFRLLKHVAGGDPDADRMWEERQKFWTAYVKRNVISEAWVILGHKARQVASTSFSNFNGHYGDLKSGNVAPLHSVLLMRIDTLIIAEWSHNGKCHMWMDENSAKPIFYENEYTRDELRYEIAKSSKEHPPFTHVKSNRPLWQSRIRNYIRRVTGIDISQNEFT